MPKRISYWEGSPEQWQLIQEVQGLKRQEIGMVGADADLIYAKEHMRELFESGAIRESRWAFLWYH
jgi:hypothetical protein